MHRDGIEFNLLVIFATQYMLEWSSSTSLSLGIHSFGYIIEKHFSVYIIFCVYTYSTMTKPYTHCRGNKIRGSYRVCTSHISVCIQTALNFGKHALPFKYYKEKSDTSSYAAENYCRSALSTF